MAVDLATARDHRYPDAPGVTVHRSFRYLRDGSPVGRALRRAHLGRVGNGLLFLAAIPRLVALARGADVVHTEGWEDLRLGVVAVAALRAAGATVVQTEHNTFERAASLERTRRTLARLTARTIVHAQADVPRAYASERGHAVVIPHGEYGGLARTGGEGDRAAARAALGIPDGAPAVLLFGQLRADKGLGDLLRAARAVPELHVIIAGEDLGAPAAEAAQLAAPELAGRVHLRAEFVPMADAADLFAAADAVVLPYPRASQSGVLLLAYGFARAVVAYPVGGLAEAVAGRRDRLALRAAGPRGAGRRAARRRRRGAAGVRAAGRRGPAAGRDALCLGRDRAAHARGLRRRAGPGRRGRAPDRADRLRPRAGVRRGDRRGDHDARGPGARCRPRRSRPRRCGSPSSSAAAGAAWTSTRPSRRRSTRCATRCSATTRPGRRASSSASTSSRTTRRGTSRRASAPTASSGSTPS